MLTFDHLSPLSDANSNTLRNVSVMIYTLLYCAIQKKKLADSSLHSRHAQFVCATGFVIGANSVFFRLSI